MNIVELIIALGNIVLNNLKISGAPAEVIQEAEAAVAGWIKVHGSDVTFEQLESLRAKPLPPAPAVPNDANPGGQPGGGH